MHWAVLKILIIIAIIYTSLGVKISETEYEEEIYYCGIDYDNIDCFSNNTLYSLDLINEFKRLSNNLTENEKHFRKFSLYFSSIERIEENAFNDITFDEILFYKTNNLMTIHWNAFSSTAKTVKTLTFYETDRLRNNPPEYDLYKAINSLVSLEILVIELEKESIHEIPDKAFETNNNLTSIHYWGEYTISKIGDYAFADSINLYQILFSEVQIVSISSKAFDSSQQSSVPLSVTMSGCSITESTFAKDSFKTLNRVMNLYLGDNNINLISEDLWNPFLSGVNNSLDLMGNPLDCNQIEDFEWLFRRIDVFKYKITSAYCQNGTALWDLDIKVSNSSVSIQTFRNQILILIVLICVSFKKTFL